MGKARTFRRGDRLTLATVCGEDISARVVHVSGQGSWDVARLVCSEPAYNHERDGSRDLYVAALRACVVEGD